MNTNIFPLFADFVYYADFEIWSSLVSEQLILAD
jgi:hypothetical protein